MTDPTRDSLILVVDDQESNVVLLERLLADAGYEEVHGITDAREVLPFVIEHEPALLLLDFHMPHLDGVQLIEQIGALPQLPYMPILMLTADVSPEARARALGAGATDFITKPLEPVEIGLRIRNALRTSQLNRELAEANRNLEHRVRERTAELARANEELRSLDQMRQDLLSMASHEMRTPLTIVRGFTEIWHRHGFPTDARQHTVQSGAVVRNVARLERLIENFLLASQIESGVVGLSVQRLSLRAVLSDAVAHLVSRGVDVSVDCAPSIEAMADPAMVEQIVSNLVSNALRYGTPPIEVRGWETDGTTHVSVRDHGAGVPADFRPRLFERFAQSSTGDRRTSTGTGLGLWIAAHLAELHGGEIRHRDAEVRGALFEVRLPRPDISC